MKRRRFLAGTSGIIAGQIGASMPAAAETTARPVSRRSRLFDNTGMSPRKTMIQDVFSWNDVTYCLYTDLPRRYWGITATTPDGATLLHHDLPKGVYLSIGIQGDRVLLNAMTYESQGRIQQNCLLRLESATNIQLLQPQGFPNRLFFAGDSTLLRIGSDVVELWRVGDLNVQRTAAARVTASSLMPHVTFVSTNTAALTRPEGTSISFIDTQSGSVREYAITVPEVLAAIGSYQASSDPSRGTPVVIPATGSNHEGTLYALICPSPPNAVRTAKFDSLGNGAAWLSLQFPPRNSTDSIAPVALIARTKEITAEMGVVFSDGAVSWYAADLNP